MQAEIDIAFEQLVKLAKQLPARQWTKLKREVEADELAGKDRDDLKKLLLAGPTFSNKQLNVIDETRKAINQWRTKSL